jgi:excisionase family DNA binding protein
MTRPFLAALIAELQDDESAKRDLAEALRPYLASVQDGEYAERLLNVTEKAAQLGLHPDTLVRMARENRIRAAKVGREWRFRSVDLPQGRRRSESPVGPAPRTRRRRTNDPPSITAIRGR